MEFLARHRDTIDQFLMQVLGEKDRAFLVQVNSQARMVTALTGSIDELRAGVDELGTREGAQAPILGERCKGPWKLGCGGTALWHGLYYAARSMRPIEGRKALIVLSDGMDTGSDRTVSDVIEAAQGAGVVVYAIKYVSPLRFISPALTLRQAFAKGMERISLETGGLTFPDPKRKISETFAQIEAELRNMYLLGFAPPEDARDGKFHKLKVSATRPDLVVRSRAGYWAVEKPSAQY
jgi:Ca-activated chloride channel homolog